MGGLGKTTKKPLLLESHFGEILHMQVFALTTQSNTNTESMSNNTTSLLLPPSCLAPRSDAENAIVAVLGVLVVLISLYDYRTTFRSLYYAFSVRDTMCLMLLVPGLYAVLNIINVYINPFGTTVHLIVDAQALLRLLYLFSLIKFTISIAWVDRVKVRSWMFFWCS